MKAADEQTPTEAQRVRKEVVNIQRGTTETTRDNTKLQGTAATIDLTDDKQSSGVASYDDINLSTCKRVGAGKEDDGGL